MYESFPQSPGYQYLPGTFSGTSSNPWTSPISSSSIITGKSIVSTKSIDHLYTSSGQYQVGPYGYIPFSKISTRLPTFEEQYFPSFYTPHARGQPMVTHFDSTPFIFGHPNVRMNVCQWQHTLPFQPQTIVHSYQLVQPVVATLIPLVNTYLPLLQTQIFVPHSSQAGLST